jgi:hypothetical protein
LKQAHIIATTSYSRSPVVTYHGLARRHLLPRRLLMRPLLNGGTLGGRVPMEFTDPEEEDTRRLALQIVAVTELAGRLGLPELTGTEADLDVIQAILDSGELEPDQTYELQSLGVVFGTALVSAVDGLDWAIVHDEYGSDPTLRYRNTTLCINVLTTISKRVEDGQSVDVRELFDGVQAALQDAILVMGGTA